MDGFMDVAWGVNGSVTKHALHNLTEHCPKDDVTFVHVGSPSTFFIQLFRFSFSLLIVTLIIVLYNSIKVLDRTILSTATCSLYWVVMAVLMALKSAVLIVCLPVSSKSHQTSAVNQAGFILTVVIQCAVVYTLFLAIEHEINFRSPDHATVDGRSRRHCIALNWRKMMCTPLRVVVIVITLVPLLLLLAVEVVFAVSKFSSAPVPLVWVLIVFLLVPRVCSFVAAVYLVGFTRGHYRPTRAGKVFLMVGVLLTLLEDVPSSPITIATKKPCLLSVMTIFDLIQVIGVFSLIFFFLFVRSQYLRVEQESKLNLVWDLQKLLQVNGRKDIIRHYT